MKMSHFGDFLAIFSDSEGGLLSGSPLSVQRFALHLSQI